MYDDNEETATASKKAAEDTDAAAVDGKDPKEMTRNEVDSVLLPLYKEAIQFGVEVLQKAFTAPQPKTPAPAADGDGALARARYACNAGAMVLTSHRAGTGA